MNIEEVVKRIGNQNIKDFFLFMRGQTVGIINNEEDYYESDVNTFIRIKNIKI
jgi:hypothetical protein